MSSTDMEALFAKIHKDQATQLELLRHTKRAMDKTIASRDGSDSGAPSLASLSFEILGDLLDEIVLDVVSEAHRDVKNMRTVCPICKTKCRNYVVRAGQDIFGQNPQNNNSQTYDCVRCQRSFPAQRYAPHLEKCLGLAGRSSSRAASRRMGAGERAGSGSPFTPVSYSDDREASDSDKDLIEKKRKKNASSSNFHSNGNGTGGSNGGADYVAPSPAKRTDFLPSLRVNCVLTVIKLGEGQETETDRIDRVPRETTQASKSGNSTKLKGLGLHTPSSSSTTTTAAATTRDPTPVGEISLGFLDDSLLLANGRSLQNGIGGGNGNGEGNGDGNGTTTTAAATTNAIATATTTQKLSSSNPKRASGGGVSSSKRPPGSSSGPSSKNGQVLSFYESLRAIGSRDGSSSDDDDNGNNNNNSSSNINGDDDDDKDQKIDRRRKNRHKKRSVVESSDDDSEYIDDDDDEGKGADNDGEGEDVDMAAAINDYAGVGGSVGGMVGVPPTTSPSSSSSSKASSQRLPPLVLRLKKSSAYSGAAATDPHDMEFIDIDGDGDEDAMDILQTPKKKKS
ncbi:Ataxin-7-like protein 3 [Mortierella sp. AD031]|nr:Ataxin-7-like protein 3 [Mortierella sp. AD031]